MDSDLFNNIMDDVQIETLIDYYNMPQKIVQTLEHKLSNFGNIGEQ
jgi:hypothetical protein